MLTETIIAICFLCSTLMGNDIVANAEQIVSKTWERSHSQLQPRSTSGMGTDADLSRTVLRHHVGQFEDLVDFDLGTSLGEHLHMRLKLGFVGNSNSNGKMGTDLFSSSDKPVLRAARHADSACFRVCARGRCFLQCRLW